MDENPPIRMDEGFFMDEPSGPGERQRMAQVNLHLDHITEDQLVAGALKYKTALTGNANFPTTNPTLTAYGALITDAQAKIAASDSANAAAKLATEAKNAAVAALHDGTVQLGGSVQSTSKGNPEQIKSAGMDTRADNAPVGDLPQVQNLHVTTGDMPGSNDLSWDILQRGVQTYIAQQASSPDGPWTQIYVGKKSGCTAFGNVSGSENWFRVCAVGANGPGPWSAPVPKRAA